MGFSLGFACGGADVGKRRLEPTWRKKIATRASQHPPGPDQPGARPVVRGTARLVRLPQ